MACLNVRFWPLPAVQVMKSTRRCPTATCDPIQPFEEKLSNDRFAGPIRLALALLLDEGTNLSGV